MSEIILPDDQRWCIGYEGRYAASYDGEIISYLGKHPKKIKGSVINDKRRGYKTYRVFAVYQEKGKNKSEYFHRLVAEAWIPNPSGKIQVNHIDHNKLNNHVENLEWVNPSDNTRAMYDFYGKDTLAQIRADNAGFGDRQNFIDFIHTGDTKKYKAMNTVYSKIDDSVWLEAGVPKEITNIILRNGSYLSNWNLIITYLDEVFNYTNTLSVIEAMFDFSYTLPSHIRSGNRWQKEVELYRMYRDSHEYTKYYTETYTVNR